MKFNIPSEKYGLWILYQQSEYEKGLSASLLGGGGITLGTLSMSLYGPNNFFGYITPIYWDDNQPIWDD